MFLVVRCQHVSGACQSRSHPVLSLREALQKYVELSLSTPPFLTLQFHEKDLTPTPILLRIRLILPPLRHILSMVGICCSVAMILFNVSSILCNASYSTIPLLFLFCFRVFVKSFRDFIIVSSGVKVGCVMYLCLKCTVSDILSLLVFLT